MLLLQARDVAIVLFHPQDHQLRRVHAEEREFQLLYKDKDHTLDLCIVLALKIAFIRKT